MAQTKKYADLELIFIKELLAEAGKCALHYFDSGIRIDSKSDGTPVTVADGEVEDLIRKAIEDKFPSDAILGEERAEKNSQSNRKWIIDPIDGTMNFGRGIPIFSVLIALEVAGDIVAGGVYNPVWDHMYLASSGEGAYKNGERLKVSEIDSLDNALVSFGGPGRIESFGLWSNLQRLVKQTYQQRGYGDYLGFAFVFEGRSEANFEVGLKPWDLAPMKIIVEESGGVFLDFEGGSSVYHGSCVVANRKLGGVLREVFLDGND